MCTAITYKTKDFYFGRNLDYDFSYGESVVVMPKNHPLKFKHTDEMKSHLAMIGVAHIEDGYPLYYDAVNEAGVGMASLNFVDNAVYSSEIESDKYNVAQFEIIPWILGQCSSVKQVRELLKNINIVGVPFSEKLPTVAQLHWLIADCSEAITVESVSEGIKIYDNPVGVLANNPTFDIQLFQLNNFMSLSSKPIENRFCDKIPLKSYSRGMGAIGLPGDLSSQSRFIRACFVKLNSVSGSTENESISQFFHILGSVEQQRGCCELENGEHEFTIYTSCCNTDKGIYYYTTYDNHRITAVDMHLENLDGEGLSVYPLVLQEQILLQNKTK